MIHSNDSEIDKTVGILTYAYYDNYGTMLQAYALQELVEQQGISANIINFKPVIKLETKELIYIRIKNIPCYFFQFNEYLKKTKKKLVLKRNKQWFEERHKLFDEFFKANIILGKKKYITCEELKEFPPEYDAYIVGSDQTWNPYVSGGPEAFFLTFVDDSTKKGSYAPSLTVTFLNEEQQKNYKERLSSFSFLSCREKAGAAYLSSMLGRPVQAVIDPTLLLRKEYWNQVAADRSSEGDYILTYFLGDVLEHRIFVEKLSQRVNMRVVSIPMSYLEFENNRFEKQMAGPAEFLALIRDARFVCTDSFHGTMFSINFGVSFFSFCKAQDSDVSAQNNRLYDALQQFGLENRIIKDFDSADTVELDVDYKKADACVAAHRKQSSDYLTEMLNRMTNTGNAYVKK